MTMMSSTATSKLPPASRSPSLATGLYGISSNRHDGDDSSSATDDSHSGSDDEEEHSDHSDGSASSYESETSCSTLLDQLDQEMLMQWPPPKNGQLLNTTTTTTTTTTKDARKSPQSICTLLTALGSQASLAYDATDDDEDDEDDNDKDQDDGLVPAPIVEQPAQVDFRQMLHKRMSMSNVTTYLQDKSYASGASSVASLQSGGGAGEPGLEGTHAGALTARDPDHPETLLQQILQSVVDDNGPEPGRLELPPDYWTTDYFVPVTPARTSAYTGDKAQALRSQNLQALHQMLADGCSMDACNAQGESLVHLAARRHNVGLLKFLHQTAGVSLKVRDDCGKTALDELSWTRLAKTQTSLSDRSKYFAAIVYVVTHCPELLVSRDKRGFTPFHYIPRESWAVWKDFLTTHQRFLQGQAELIAFQVAKHRLQQTLQRIP